MYSFYIEYEDDSIKLIEGLTKLGAKRKYSAYGKRPELNAKGWGWMTADEYPVSYEILKNRAMRSAM